MNKKEKITIAVILICTAFIIIIPGIISARANKKDKVSEKLGDVVLTENLGLTEAELEDSEFEVTDGPTGGDEPDIYNFQFRNADELIDKGVTFGLLGNLYDSFSHFQNKNEEYRGEAVYMINYDTYLDNDSQTYFEFTSQRYEGVVFQLVYNKSDNSINISVN